MAAATRPYDGSPQANTAAIPGGDWPRRLDRLAAEWRLPAAWVDAAWLSLGGATPDDSRRAAAQTAADALAEWQRAWLPDPAAPPADRLRALFRAVWCDAPDFRNVLMLLAAAHLRLFALADETAARDARDLYVPVAGMLGLYRLRYRWAEESTRRLRREAYAAAAGELGLGDDDLSAEDLEEVILARQTEWIDPHPAAELLPSSKPLHPWADRLRFFNQLRGEMLAGLRDEFGDAPPELELLPLLPGKIIGHASERHASERHAERGADIEQAPEMIIRVLCADVSACYRALGVVHRVAQLLRPGHAPLFRDYISYPQPNGYRALQTVCEWSRNRKNQRIVKFHILTPEMHRLNEWGVLARPAVAPDAWWNHLERYARRLPGNTGASRATPAGEARIVAYLRDHPPGDPTPADSTDPIYCFTPIGQLVFLTRGSMPLDFAYQLHTQLGHQAARFEINGRPEAINTELKNGDLVQITLDPLASHLDFSWLDCVRSRGGRDKVRAGLWQRARAVHEGRYLFEAAVARRLELYKKEHQRRARRSEEPYKPAACSSLEIDRFLRRVALRRGDSVAALYDAIAADHAKKGDLAAQLAHQLISEGIIAAVRAADGTALRGEYAGIELCEACRPTPIDIIRGRARRRVRRQPEEGDILVIHADDCPFVPTDDRTVHLQWAAPDGPEKWPQFHFEIEIDDDHRLLDRILEMVYELPGVYLYRVDARVNQERRAAIDLAVAAKLPQLCHDLKLCIEQLSGARADYHSVPGEPMADIRVADMSRALKNPYTETEVYDWRFYDREDVSEAIAHWVYAPGMSQILLLHGPRRVGKTSLVLRLLDKGRLEEVTARPVVPVLIDFRKMALPQPQTVAQLIAQRVFGRLGLEMPRLGSGDDPLVWLDARLTEAESHLGQARLLLIVDEFDADLLRLAGDPPENALRVLLALRALFTTHPAIRWLLIVQDVFLADPRFHEAFPMTPQAATRLGVTHLHEQVARRLITDLSAARGITYGQADLPDQIVAWTGGNPWLIHRICYRLLDRIAYYRRAVVSQQDLFFVIHQVLALPSSVNHYTEHLPAGSPRRLIACQLAHSAPLGQSLALATLRAELCRRRGLMSPRALDAHVAFLQQVGVLDTSRKQEGRFVGFPIQLVHQWLIENTDAEGNDTPDGPGLSYSIRE